jgi:hypothetical protein
MGMEYFPGPMVGDMKASTVMIRNIVKAHILGLMEESIRGNGKMISDMEKANILSIRILLNKDYGKMIKGLNG